MNDKNISHQIHHTCKNQKKKKKKKRKKRKEKMQINVLKDMYRASYSARAKTSLASSSVAMVINVFHFVFFYFHDHENEADGKYRKTGKFSLVTLRLGVFIVYTDLLNSQRDLRLFICQLLGTFARQKDNVCL